VSENGPREGTRDLPRPPPEAGRRAVAEDSPAGIAYSALERSLRRRRGDLVALIESGASPSAVAKAYESDHPLEPAVTPDEIRVAVAEAKRRPQRRPAVTAPRR
jgi:hypothetical protein